MGEDVAWPPIPFAEGDFWGQLEVADEAPEPCGRGVAGRRVGAAGEDRGVDERLGILACGWEGVDAVIPGEQRAVSEPPVDASCRKARPEELAARDVACLPTRELQDRRFTGSLGDLRLSA
jgi:hypothetical protein